MRQENIEFARLFEASGWSQSFAAKRLWKDRATVNRYLNGKIVPEQNVLEHFKLILASEMPGKVTAFKEESLARWEQQLLNELRQLQVADRDRVLNTVRAMIKGLPVRAAIHYELKPKCRDCGPKEN